MKEKEEAEVRALVAEAREGRQAALEGLIRLSQDWIYNLALRMLWSPADAQDASQEILIKIITHLSQFREESSFQTWAYRIAVNHLLTTRKGKAEQRELSFEKFGEMLEAGLAMNSPERVDDRLLLKEVELTCTLGMLLCLDREDRVAYLLGEVFEVTGQEGADLMEVSPEAYRKRLSRARTRLRTFMERQCGIINPASPCRCSRQVVPKIQGRMLNPDRLLFGGTATLPVGGVERSREELKNLDRVAAYFRSHPRYAAPEVFIEAIRKVLNSGKFQILEEEN